MPILTAIHLQNDYRFGLVVYITAADFADKLFAQCKERHF